MYWKSYVTTIDAQHVLGKLRRAENMIKIGVVRRRSNTQSIWFQSPQVWEIKSRLFDFSSLPSFSLSHSGRGRSGGQSSLRARAGGSVRRAERERKRERAGRSKRARRKEAESSNSSGSQQASRASKDSERAKRARQRERRASEASGEEKKRVRMVRGTVACRIHANEETEEIRTQFRHTEEHTQRGRMTELWPKFRN